MGFVHRTEFRMTRKHDVQKTGCYRSKINGMSHLLCWVLWKELTNGPMIEVVLSTGPNRAFVSLSSHLKMETDPVSETLCFLII
jgi:hypothetical protein